MISKQAVLENAKVLASLAINVFTAYYCGVRAIQMIDIRVALPRDHLALAIVNGLH